MSMLFSVQKEERGREIGLMLILIIISTPHQMVDFQLFKVSQRTKQKVGESILLSQDVLSD